MQMIKAVKDSAVNAYAGRSKAAKRKGLKVVERNASTSKMNSEGCGMRIKKIATAQNVGESPGASTSKVDSRHRGA